ncbi:MAG: hypothetical protein DWI29_04890, partial [Planctomycetota bacterium]
MRRKRQFKKPRSSLDSVQQIYEKLETWGKLVAWWPLDSITNHDIRTVEIVSPIAGTIGLGTVNFGKSARRLTES